MHNTRNKTAEFHKELHHSKIGQKVWKSYSYSGAQVMFGTS